MDKENIISKEELSKLLNSFGVPVDEGIALENKQNKTHIVYWPFLEEDIRSSGTAIKNLVTYQISIFSSFPQCREYKELRKKLREKGIQPTFQHEFVEKDAIFSRMWHTFFSVDVLEEVD